MEQSAHDGHDAGHHNVRNAGSHEIPAGYVKVTLSEFRSMGLQLSLVPIQSGITIQPKAKEMIARFSNSVEQHPSDCYIVIPESGVCPSDISHAVWWCTCWTMCVVLHSNKYFIMCSTCEKILAHYASQRPPQSRCLSNRRSTIALENQQGAQEQASLWTQSSLERSTSSSVSETGWSHCTYLQAWVSSCLFLSKHTTQTDLIACIACMGQALFGLSVLAIAESHHDSNIITCTNYSTCGINTLFEELAAHLLALQQLKYQGPRESGTQWRLSAYQAMQNAASTECSFDHDKQVICIQVSRQDRTSRHELYNVSFMFWIHTCCAGSRGRTQQPHQSHPHVPTWSGQLLWIFMKFTT